MPKKLFQPGQSGRPRGTRNKLQADFLRDLAEAWSARAKLRFWLWSRTNQAILCGWMRA